MKKPYDYKMDEVFREAFTDFKPTPPGHVLDNIKTSYNQHSAGTGGNGISNFVNNNWVILSVTSVVSLVFVGLILLNVDINGADKNNEDLLMANTILIPDNNNTPVNTNPEKSIIHASDNSPLNDNNTENIYTKTDPDNNTDNKIIRNNNMPPAPKANAGEYEDVCGLSCLLNAKYSKTGTSGIWTAETENVKFESGSYDNPATDPNAKVTVGEYGDCSLVWTEYDKQNKNVKSSDNVHIRFIEPPQINAGNDMNVCGNTASLELKGSNYGGHWNSMAGVSYENINSPTTKVRYKGTGKLEFVWTENIGSCTYTDNVNVTFSDAPSAEFTVLDKPKCFGSPAKLDIINKSLERYQWDLDGGTATGNKNETIDVIWKSGISHNITLTVWDEKGCSSSKTMAIEQPPRLEPGFYHSEPVANMPLPIYFTNTTKVNGIPYSENEGISFKWRFGDGEVSTEDCPHHYYTSHGDYTVALYALTPEGCVDSIVIPNISINGQSLVDIPNVFTPNADGRNDIYKVKVRELTEFKGIIMTRMGRKVYEWNDPEGGWDGRINGNDFAEPGVYFCIITGVGNDGKRHQIKDFLHLKYR